MSCFLRLGCFRRAPLSRRSCLRLLSSGRSRYIHTSIRLCQNAGERFEDTPVLQLPEMDGGQYPENPNAEIDPANYEYSVVMPNFRPGVDVDYKHAGLDHDPHIALEEELQLLPEEPLGAYEILGKYPFLVAATAIIFSKEFVMLGTEFYMTLWTPIYFMWWGYFLHFFERQGARVHQRDMDTSYFALIANHTKVDQDIVQNESLLKNMDWANQYENYVHSLAVKKSAFRTHMQKRQFTEKLSAKLKRIFDTQRAVTDNLRNDLCSSALSFIGERMNTDEKLKQQVVKNGIEDLKAVLPFVAGKPLPEREGDVLSTLWQEFIKKFKANVDKDVDTAQKLDPQQQRLIDVVHQELSDLKVYGDQKVSEKIAPRMTGLWGSISAQQAKDNLIPKDEIKKRQLAIIQKQKSVFHPNKIPDSLLQLEKSLQT